MVMTSESSAFVKTMTLAKKKKVGKDWREKKLKSGRIRRIFTWSSEI